MTQPPAPAPAPQGRGAGLWGRETPAQSAAGLILGLLVWGWVIMPLISNGPTGVKDMLRAKFFNKGPKGDWLP